MRGFRRRLAGVVCLCVLSQVAAYAAAPAVLEYANALDRQNLPACCRLHGPHDTCPMDQSRLANRRSGAPRLFDPCCSPDTAVLTMLGAVGLIPASARMSVPDPIEVQAAWTPDRHVDFSPAPNNPPPRH